MNKQGIKRQGQREIELPSLIDMVFLLLVFFIVNFSISTDAAIPIPPPEIELPRVTGTAASFEEGKIITLTFQIQRTDTADAQARKVIYVLQPGSEGQTEKQALERIKAAAQQSMPDCSSIAVFNRNFLSKKGAELDSMRAFKLIAGHIQKYRTENFNAASVSNTIEVIADVSTEFKIINYIFEQCAKDTVHAIPKLTFRVMPPNDIKKEEE